MVRYDPRNDRTYLNPHEFKTVCESTERDSVELCIRLMGRSSPRIGKAVEVKPKQFFIPEDPKVDLVFVRLNDTKDSSDSDTSGNTRLSWVPWNLYQDIIDYCDENAIGPDDHIFELNPDQMRNRIQDAAEAAAIKLDKPLVAQFNPHDCRVFYATHMVRRLRVDKEIVKAMGGWDSDPAINIYLDTPKAYDMQNELARAGVVQRDVPAPPRKRPLAQLHEEIRRLREEVRELRAMQSIEERVSGVSDLTVNQLEELAEETLEDSEDPDVAPAVSEQENISKFFYDDDSDPSTALTGLGAVGAVATEAGSTLRSRLQAEIDDVGEGPDPLSLPDHVEASGVAVSMVLLLSFVFALCGIYIDIGTMAVRAPPSAASGLSVGLVAGTARVLWHGR